MQGILLRMDHELQRAQHRRWFESLGRCETQDQISRWTGSLVGRVKVPRGLGLPGNRSKGTMGLALSLSWATVEEGSGEGSLQTLAQGAPRLFHFCIR